MDLQLRLLVSLPENLGLLFSTPYCEKQLFITLSADILSSIGITCMWYQVMYAVTNYQHAMK